MIQTAPVMMKEIHFLVWVCKSLHFLQIKQLVLIDILYNIPNSLLFVDLVVRANGFHSEWSSETKMQ